MDLQTITDIKELKALRGDEYQRREEATVVIRQTEQNISLITRRIDELEAEEAEQNSEKEPEEI